jgi:hypothetical protein
MSKHWVERCAEQRFCEVAFFNEATARENRNYKEKSYSKSVWYLYYYNMFQLAKFRLGKKNRPFVGS